MISIRQRHFLSDAFQLDLVMGLSYPPDGVHTNLVLSLGPQNELELMAPIGEKGFLTDFLKKHGEGFHHLALEVTDIDQATRHLEEKGVRIFGETTHKGMRFTFLQSFINAQGRDAAGATKTSEIGS